MAIFVIGQIITIAEIKRKCGFKFFNAKKVELFQICNVIPIWCVYIIELLCNPMFSK